MVQNRNKLLDLLIGNLANAAVHKVLMEAAEDELRKKYYDDEISNSIEIAQIYREKINPVNEPLSDKDAAEVKESILRKAEAELKLRIAKGYKNVKLDLVDKFVDELLIEMNILNPS